MPTVRLKTPVLLVMPSGNSPEQAMRQFESKQDNTIHRTWFGDCFYCGWHPTQAEIYSATTAQSGTLDLRYM